MYKKWTGPSSLKAVSVLVIQLFPETNVLTTEAPRQSVYLRNEGLRILLQMSLLILTDHT